MTGVVTSVVQGEAHGLAGWPQRARVRAITPALGAGARAVRRPGIARQAAPVQRPTPPLRGRGRVRLTRRGRLVALVVGLVLVSLVAVGAFAGGRASAAGSRAPEQVVMVTVQPGETLWALARRLAPGEDPHSTVERLARHNALSSGQLRPGRQLVWRVPQHSR